MKTVTIQIGNTDDKLTQVEWSLFALRVDDVIKCYAHQVHFHGFSAGDAPWQNACWAIELDDPNNYLRKALVQVRKAHRQTSIAWTEGETVMI